MTRTLAIFLVAFAVFATFATLANDQLQVVVQPQARPTKNLLLVVDASCSMTGEAWAVARGYSSMIAQQGVDEMNLGLLAFKDEPMRMHWPGAKGLDWVRLPDAKALLLARQWIDGIPAGGGTNATKALKHALADTRDPLTVVLVSDGEFDNQSRAVQAVEDLQAVRKKSGLKPAVITCLGVATPQGIAHVSTDSAMGKLAKRWKGGLYRRVIRPRKGGGLR